MIKKFTVDKPWGGFTQFTHNQNSTVKILTINPGEEFSLQKHEHRAEFWQVLEGNPKVVIGSKTLTGRPGDNFWIPAGIKHRLSNPRKKRGKKKGPIIQVLEISLGDFKEEDIIRYEDKYGRSG